MKKIKFEPEVFEEEKAKSVLTVKDKTNNKAIRIFVFFELAKIVISIICVIIGIILIKFDNHIALNIGTITFKDASIANVSINMGTLLCGIGLFFFFLSAKYLKIKVED